VFENLKADYHRYSRGQAHLWAFPFKALQDAGFRAMVLYRAGRWCRLRRLHLLAGLCERLIRHLCLCWIGTRTEIGPGLKIAHCTGLVIGGKTVLGAHCDVRQNTTFGANFHKTGPDGRQSPIVGDHVSVGAGAVIIGPVRIGSRCVIGANAVVTRDIPDHMIAAGVPARVIKPRWTEDSGRGYDLQNQPHEPF
jgi:serine O-acetyltransferase